MMPRLLNDDPAQCVISVVPGHRYPCPSLNALDAHLRYLRIATRTAVDSEGLELCRTDIDRLLDRRLFLMLTSTVS